MADENRPRRFRYTWSRTWDDKAEDYLARDGETSIGRVYRINSISTGGWFWTMNGRFGNRFGSDSGQVADRDEACRLVEEAWDRMKATVERPKVVDRQHRRIQSIMASGSGSRCPRTGLWRSPKRGRACLGGNRPWSRIVPV